MQVLVVDKVPARRKALRSLLVPRGVGLLEVPDPLAAMTALGRADFDVVVVAEERRTMAIRGLLALARKRHPRVGFLVLSEGTHDAATLSAMLGFNVEVAAPGVELAPVLWRVLGDAATPLPASFPADLPSSMPPADAAPIRKPPPAPDGGTAVHLQGSLEDDSGAALLLGLFSQELDGRLSVEQPGGEGVMYFLQGEPVFVEEAGGDAALWRRFMGAGIVPPSTPRPPVPPGHLLSALPGLCTGEALHSFLKAMVRDQVLALSLQATGSYVFDEDRSFAEHVPLIRVNPVGLIMEARRRSIPPQDLVTLSGGLDLQYLHPAPALAVVSRKLEPFLRGASAVDLVDGAGTVGEFCTRSGLGALMGTLVVQVLVETRLVSLHDTPFRADGSSITLRRALPTSRDDEDTGVFRVPEADVDAPGEQDQAVRDEIFALYARLKPLKLPRQVLGVTAYADRAAIDDAYQRLMVELDGKRIPEGSARMLLGARVEEIRHKVQASRQALLLEMDEGNPDNPF